MKLKALIFDVDGTIADTEREAHLPACNEVTLSHEAQVKAMLQIQMLEFASAFNPILGKEAGPKHAPGSPLYTRCLAELGLPRDVVLVIEDSEGRTAAAVEAGLPVVVAYSDYTENGRFPGARLITPTLASFTLEQLSFLCLES
jgi:beta-phosphoglucomutase-like phosphatase (HAD superfamily)